ncbi:hypothetical protein [Oceanobacillus kapialis]|uniref:Uncharacterized protein n=1 Tax=Oceanobacillus kapialis TaxID=481353 RepID=A0ABW5PXI8_9BACI
MAINSGAIANDVMEGIVCVNCTVVCNGITMTGKSGNLSNGLESNGGFINADYSYISGFERNGSLATRTGTITV